uniref:glycogenin glucosyltransferase n=2 Tax=Arion vulgaris TaxID=1028688 RepID=A0A0B7AY53_9EUPU
MVDGREKDEAFVTLATNDTYALGCLVVGSSLRRVATTRQLVVMITDGVSPSMRNQLGGLFDHTISVNLLDSTDTANLELLGRPDLSVTFTKLQCWRLTQFKKCVFLDADTLVIQNVDELFDREELSAAPDSGWPDCFNSGVFVYVPSDETYRNLLTFAITTGSFDGGDQGLLNLFFSSWATEDIGKHLPFTYNVVSQAFYSYLPALKQFHENVKVVHFIGPVKPWHHAYNTATGSVTQLPNTGNNQEFLQTWWDIFMDSVQPHLDPLINVFVRIEHRAPSPVHDSPQAASEVYQTNQDNSSHHHHHQDHHGHGDIRAQPTITYQVVYPYTPPELDKPHHHDVSPESKPYHEDSSQSNIVEIPVVYRDYKSFEAHYMEEPFSSVNPELPPIEHYTASVEIQGPAFVYGEGGDNNSNQSGPAQEDIVNVKNQGGHLDEIIAQVDSVESSGEVHVAGLTEDGADEVKERPVSDDKDDENGNISEKGGIVGDLANLTLADDGGPAKNDRERRLQWEQGQADYMGVDRFDNIKARLDEKITGASGSQTVVEDE